MIVRRTKVTRSEGLLTLRAECVELLAPGIRLSLAYIVVRAEGARPRPVAESVRNIVRDGRGGLGGRLMRHDKCGWG